MEGDDDEEQENEEQDDVEEGENEEEGENKWGGGGKWGGGLTPRERDRKWGGGQSWETKLILKYSETRAKKSFLFVFLRTLLIAFAETNFNKQMD